MIEHRRTAIALGLALTLMAGPAMGSYSHQTFGDVAKRAKAILVGEIVAVRPDEYDFRVEETIRVPDPDAIRAGTKILIRRFQDWSCASRWRPYESGQKLIVFLAQSKGSRGGEVRWHALGAANEGEMPIENEHLFVGGNGDGSPCKESHTVYGSAFRGRAFELKTVLDALRTGRIPPDMKRAPR